MLLYQTLAFTIYGKIQKSHTKITWNEFELSDGSYSVLYIQYHFKYILKKDNTVKKHEIILQ